MVNDKVQHEDKTAEEVSKLAREAGKKVAEQGEGEHVVGQTIRASYKGADKLKDKIAIITGGDSGIGRAVAVHFAREGAKVVILYHKAQEDAEKTIEMLKEEGCEDCFSLAGNVGDQKFCKSAVAEVVQRLGGLDIVVNNAGMQKVTDDIQELTPESIQRTFAVNLFAMFYMAQAALPHLKPGSTIINSTSVNSYRGHSELLDYSSTKGGISTLTRTLAQLLMPKGIRVNAVAPGPIWTPLIPETMGDDCAATFGQGTPMKRAGQPSEVAPSYVYLASDDSSYVTGTVMHPNGGTVLNV